MVKKNSATFRKIDLGDMVFEKDLFTGGKYGCDEFVEPAPDVRKCTMLRSDACSRLNPAYPLQNNSPHINFGDLRPIYASRTRAIPEKLDEEIFLVDDETPARIMEDDLEFFEGMSRIFGTEPGFYFKSDEYPARSVGQDKLRGLNFLKQWSCGIYNSPTPKTFENTYLIVDVGHAHLAGLAYVLRKNGVDCSFFISEKPHDRMREALKYWAGKMDIESDRSVYGYATMIDIHRGSGLDKKGLLPKDAFPIPEKLKELGIERVIYLSESSVDKSKKRDWTCSKLDVFFALKLYRDAGFDVSRQGIDYRQNREGELGKPVHIIKNICASS
ncbi:hypothetical protein HOK51_04835 [Candidatus Woesearchaeota archaeon]|jgi:hypothetical protein|nr:hypothetical protein [Candidatus Woesearchaeota archaeon]MBT6519151.1 hypothetical protein [Candidatus Woesearchaeota archaeon]MBT7367798.1 hypothetical protein [Candidatus Woesearchaeota archaeon]